MLAFDLIAEERIGRAIARGEFENLPGAGSPLSLEDDALVPIEVRAAYRMLKNAGLVPPEVAERREVAALEFDLSIHARDSGPYLRALRELEYLRLKQAERGCASTTVDRIYHQRIIEKLCAAERVEKSER